MSTPKQHPALPRAAALKLFAAALLAAVAAPAALAQSYWTEGHGDIGIELHGDHFHTHWNVDGGGIVDGAALPQLGEEYAPHQLIAWVRSSLPATSAVASALGVSTGSTVYRAGNSNYQPNLGFAANGIGGEELWEGSGGGLTVSLTDWVTPSAGANFALMNNSNSLFFSTLLGGGNSFHILAGSHQHYSFLFSEAGYYELSFTWSGIHETYGLIEITDTFGFQVGAIPEPSTWALLLSSATGLGVLIVRRRKRA